MLPARIDQEKFFFNYFKCNQNFHNALKELKLKWKKNQFHLEDGIE